MSLTPGTRLGHYEIVSALGAGGMGEVYRARDTRLGRVVAVKVMPGHLAAQPDLRARFEREARTASSLNHPNICTLHDIGREGDIDFIVMELVEGESLAQRLTRGPVSAAEALRIGAEVADALDKAHRAGIVHRDLKPGNIMLGKSGAKLMDFGLARAAGLAPAAGSATLSHAPTATRALTAEGTIVGTFQYMAPEQLEGNEADVRSDLWSLGVVLYEMTTGLKAFSGPSQASLIASILKDTPRPASQVQPLAPPGLDRLIQACLAKDPDQRVQTAHDVKLQLQWIAEGGSQAGVPAPVAAHRRRRESLAWGLAIVGLAAVLAIGSRLVLQRRPPERVLRFEIGAPPGTTTLGWPRLSPDGQTLAFLAADSLGITAIWVRPLDALDAHPLAGTQRAGRPFWSPDSRYLGYIAEEKLRKIPVAGGPSVALAETPGAADGSWGTQNLILFDGTANDSIRGVPASGGVVRGISRIDRKAGDGLHGWPYFLPDGRHYLYVAYASQAAGRGTIRAADTDSKLVRDVGTTDGRVEYAPEGYIVFTLDGTLLAQKFDARGLKVLGDPVPIGENVAMGNASGFFSTSAAGMLAYRTNRARQQGQLKWYDRNGMALGDEGAPGEFHDIALSPDGKRIALGIVDAAKGREDIWVRQIDRGVTSRLTFEDGDEINPIWSPDGQKVAYASNRRGAVFATYIRLASGVGGEDSTSSGITGHQGPIDWSSDGRTLLVRTLENGAWNLYMQPLAPGGKSRPFIATPFNEFWGKFSPDARWIAYASNESGRSEVYVQAADGSGGKWQISNASGTEPQWRSDGREIFYRSTVDQTIYAVPVSAGATFEAGNPVALFKPLTVESSYNGMRWTPAAGGQRLLVNTPLRGPERAQFIVVTHWTNELKNR